MNRLMPVRYPRVQRKFFLFLLAISGLSGNLAVYGVRAQEAPQPEKPQSEKPQSEKLAYGVDKASVPIAIARLKSGDFTLVDVDIIARANAIEAVPVLKEKFHRIDDQMDKAKLAAALVRLRNDDDDTYWNFLVDFAKPALESDMPDYNEYDQQGKAISGPSPEFQVWAKARNLPPDAPVDPSIGVAFGGIFHLGWTRDERAVPLLKKALLSRNRKVEIMGAMGLAEIGDKQAIPFIIEACKRAPAEPAAVMAESLVYFDDVSAQKAVDQFVPAEQARIARQARASGLRPSPLSPPLLDSPRDTAKPE